MNSVSKMLIGYLLLFFIFSPTSFADERPSPSIVSRVKLQLKQDKSAINRVNQWKALLQNKKPRSQTFILKEVNTFFNRLTYIPIDPLKSDADIWLTPYEFLAQGGGNCKDFAIAKYFTLVAVGIPQDKLKITYVTIPERQLAHMVLAFYPTPSADPFILDSLREDILPASQRTDLVPVYSFNAGGVWLNERIGKTRPYGKPSDLKQWQSMLERIKLEEN